MRSQLIMIRPAILAVLAAPPLIPAFALIPALALIPAFACVRALPFVPVLTLVPVSARGERRAGRVVLPGVRIGPAASGRRRAAAVAQVVIPVVFIVSGRLRIRLPRPRAATSRLTRGRRWRRRVSHDCRKGRARRMGRGRRMIWRAPGGLPRIGRDTPISAGFGGFVPSRPASPPAVIRMAGPRPAVPGTDGIMRTVPGMSGPVPAVPGMTGPRRAVPGTDGIMRTIAEIASALPGIPRIAGIRARGPLIAAPPPRFMRLRLFAAHVPIRPPGVLTRHRRPAQILLVRRPSAAHEPSHP